MAIVKINDIEYYNKFKKEIEYYLDDRLKRSTDIRIIEALRDKDKDFFGIVDGPEGAGKSWFAMQWGKYVDNSLNLSRIVFTPEEFKEAIFKAKKNQCIIYDEAFTGMGARSSLSSINRYLVSLAMQIRQKNLFIILVLPSVFLLDKYFVMFRAKCLVHVYENKGRRGYFRVYNPRKIKELIMLGKQTMSYSKKVWTKFKGRFYGKFALGDELEDVYRKKKAKALEESEKNPMSAGQVKYREQRDTILYCLRKLTKLSYKKIENYLGDYEVDLTYQQIRNICAKRGDKEQEEDEKDYKQDKIDKNGVNSKENDFNDTDNDVIDEKEEENDELEPNNNVLLLNSEENEQEDFF